MKKKLLSPSIGYIPPCLGELGEKYRHTHAGAVLPKLNCTLPKKKEPITNFRQGKSLVPRPGEKKKTCTHWKGLSVKTFPRFWESFAVSKHGISRVESETYARFPAIVRITDYREKVYTR